MYDENIKTIADICRNFDINRDGEEIERVFDSFYKLLQAITENMYEVALSHREMNISFEKLKEYDKLYYDMVDAILSIGGKGQDNTSLNILVSNYTKIMFVYAIKAYGYGIYYNIYNTEKPNK